MIKLEPINILVPSFNTHNQGKHMTGKVDGVFVVLVQI
jgi:hypothetical protein